MSAGTARPVALADALSERYLAYALSTITARSLPDVRDGLKPVHRRLLYAMLQLRLDPGQGFKKCARVVGDVMGKFHPHGDQSIYDAMVRLAQDFAQRYPLVDGQGNFGNLDGDNAAAMRYTEARLTEVAQALLQGIDEDAVDFRATYDGEGAEPVVLPAAFPNLLANGAQGIAVGMATAIPPHNAGELCDALTHLIADPSAPVAALLAHVPGPDFPTGGLLVEGAEAIRQAYETGRGSFRLRARYVVERLGHGLWQAVVTEIPYQVQKSKLVERIAELLQAKKLAMLADVRDESTTEVRLVLEPRSRTVDPAVLMESLFRQTDLELRVPLNLNVLDADGTPKVMNLAQALRAFLDHRRVVLLRRSRHRLGEIARRLDVLAGYLIAYLNLDEVIRIIREEDEPKPALMRRFELSDVQAEAILNMRLRALRRLEEIEIRKEHAALTAEQADLAALVDSEARQWSAIGKEIAAIRARFGPDTALGRRRTALAEPPPAVVVPIEAVIEREPATVVCSAKGWIRVLRGHLQDDGELRYKDGDEGRFIIRCETTDRLMVYASDGKFYTLPVDRLPKGRGHGEPLRLMIDLGNEEEVVALFPYRADSRLLVASSDGRGFLVKAEDCLAQTRAGRQVLVPAEGARALWCLPAAGDSVAALGQNRKLLVFGLDEVPEMQRGRGVILQKYKDGGLADLAVFTRADGLAWVQTGGKPRVEMDLRPWLAKRATAGRQPPRGFGRFGRG